MVTAWRSEMQPGDRNNDCCDKGSNDGNQPQRKAALTFIFRIRTRSFMALHAAMLTTFGRRARTLLRQANA
jgi:hypothetical protein